MLTEKLRIEDGVYQHSVNRAAEILASGGTVAIPTETVYGLAVSAYDDIAIKKVFVAKGRPQDNPLIVHISDMQMLEELVSNIPNEALICAQKFWPGPFTMVLPKTSKISSLVSAGLETVAVRMPSHKVALDIIKKSRLPLAAPSANISGSPSPTSALHVESDLYGKIDAIVYADDCTVGVESTVVSFCSQPARLLRPGAVTVEQLKEIIPDLVVDKSVSVKPPKNMKVHSPGVKYKHYSPKTEAFLIESDSQRYINFVNNSNSVAAICFSEEAELISVSKIIYGSFNDELSMAHSVFSALREVDKLNVKKVYIHAPSKKGVGLAVYNRLLRAAGFKVISLENIIGITGPTGAGKSSLMKTAEEKGFKVIDCDKLARMAVEKGRIGLNALVDVFGQEILFSSGELNRKKLAEVAFSSKEKTLLLNRTIFPFITELVIHETIGNNKIILDAPTLFESGIDCICKKTVAVLADEKIRLKRILQRDNITEFEAKLRIGAGKSDDFYKQNADFVLINNGDRHELISAFEKILKSIFSNII